MSASQTGACHVLQPYWDVALASVQADALRIALELDVFRLLSKPLPASAVAQQRSLHVDNTAHLLELLWSMQLLERQDCRDATGQWRYYASNIAAQYLNPDSVSYCGDAWRFRLRSLRQFGGQMDELLRSGQPGREVSESSTASAWQAAARVQICQEQRAATAGAAKSLVLRLPEFARAERLLDLGGGPGWVAIALASANKRLRGVVYDLPQAAAVARENIEREGLEQRLKAEGGDLTCDDFGEGYDLIWCSSVLHFVPDLMETLRRIKAALRPGGVLVCAHAELSDTPSAARKVMPYYLSLRMRGRLVTRDGELYQALQSVGFSELDSHSLVPFPMAPVTVLVGRRKMT
ncbi:class I SAM-dependent methyltransferase [Halomonas huangheensis]|uniref:O-methyltransferase dimerisation domain-containing protein n=1 Tax=Halomonas huangheensis TaxID=1178482 RepID=W1N1F2_9GAMM|nr:class I SAM-dependent methyltransferase [Halomonas huangheensis]ALM52370.1 O-methyltransferase [Halomonas huangheensis]ERL49308.1 hypothetical protein BJB45_07495 [Halomonas huangheensis]